MKRKVAWLALPLVLLALMIGVKWRADHLTATKEDLEIRALLTSVAGFENGQEIHRNQAKSGVLRLKSLHFLWNSD